MINKYYKIEIMFAVHTSKKGKKYEDSKAERTPRRLIIL